MAVVTLVPLVALGEKTVEQVAVKAGRLARTGRRVADVPGAEVRI
jgi:hypothetical protein